MNTSKNTSKINPAKAIGTGSVLFLTLFFAAELHAQTLLDPASMECIDCHSIVSMAVPAEVCHAGGCDHPIGVDYALLSSQNPALVKPASLNPGVKLVGNKISCVTCHVPYSNADHEALSQKRSLMPAIPDPMLSIDNTASALCSACHAK